MSRVKTMSRNPHRMEMGGRTPRFLVKASVSAGNKRAFLKTALSILAGITIGLLATLILRFMSGLEFGF